MHRLITVALAVALGLGAGSQAAVPFYDTYQLQCRANFGAAFNLPAGSFFTSSTPAINNAGQVAVNLVNVNVPGNPPGVWFGQGGTGQVKFVAADSNATIGSISLNHLGRAVFPQNFTSPNGVYFYDAPSDTSGLLTTQPIGASSFGTPIVNDLGQVGYRVSFLGSNAWVSFAGAPPVAFHAVEAALDAASPYSFLFTPSFNNSRQIAGKVRLGAAGQTGENRPDQIRIINPDGTFTIIAHDRDSDPNSLFLSFDNSVALTDNGWVAFNANLFPAGRGVFFSNGVETRTIAVNTAGIVSTIESFGPAASASGLVAFRAFENNTALRAIWIGDGTTLRRVVREHDIVPTDLGPARIDQHDASPVFGGSITINRYGDVAFNAALTPPDNNQIEWGSGIFVALARTPGDVDCDGDVDFDDIDAFVAALSGPAAYAAQYPDCRWLNADCDGDGDVDFDDIDPFVALIGS
ncbi:MAG: hypothetical protein IPM13_10610 [Phycisphaerales bacterium]|nr:hypothetical protein [Phycisphaerales bacterium]